MTTGQKLKRLRELKILSQDELAEQLNKRYKTTTFTRNDITNWENDRNYPEIPKIKILSRYFKVSLDDLLFDHRTEFLTNAQSKSNMKVA